VHFLANLCKTKAPYTRIRIFLNPRLFLTGYGFRPHASGEIRAGNPNIFASALQSGKKEIRNESDNVWPVNPDIFDYDDAAKSFPVSYRIVNQSGGTTCRPIFSRVNPDTIGCVWTGEFDWNTLRAAGEIFESEKKKVRIQKYPDTCGRRKTSTPRENYINKTLS